MNYLINKCSLILFYFNLFAHALKRRRQWRGRLERFPRMQKVGCSIPKRDRPMSQKGCDQFTAKRSATVESVMGPPR